MAFLDDTIASVHNNIIKTRDVDTEFNPNGLGDHLYKLMLNNSLKIAQIDGVTGETQTYEFLLSKCVAAAKAMQKFSIEPGDVITLCTGNHLDTCIPFIASLFIGVYCVSVDVALRDDEMRGLLNKFEPKIIFCSSKVETDLVLRLKKYGINSTVVVFGESRNYMSFKDFLASTPESSIFEVYKAKSLKDTAFMSLTGGSTGNHKAVMLHHLSMFNFVNTAKYPFETPVLLSFAPMMWISGPFSICRAITYGYARLILRKFDPKIFFRLIDNYKISDITLSCFAITQLLKEKVPKEVNISYLKHINYVGCSLSKTCVEELRKMLPKTVISSRYGQTEVGGFLLYYDWGAHPEYFNGKSESVGKPLKGISYKVIDINTGEVLGPNKAGHLLVKTDFQMNGYFKSDSSHVWDEGSWLKTGDIFYYDEQHFFYFVDRMKEMIRYRSWAVSPVYLENILMKHPSVELAFVTAVPHDEDGDHPIGIVVLKDGKTATTIELENFINDQVEEPRKMREGIKIVERDFVPYSAVGKIKRYEFRRKILELLFL